VIEIRDNGYGRIEEFGGKIAFISKAFGIFAGGIICSSTEVT